MAASPETLNPESQIKEINTNAEFVVDETLKSAGVQTVQKDFKSQIRNDSGKPIIQTPPTQVISVSPPADSTALGQMAGGNTSNASTWYAKFWLRILQKALHFGWRIIGNGQNAN